MSDENSCFCSFNTIAAAVLPSHLQQIHNSPVGHLVGEGCRMHSCTSNRSNIFSGITDSTGYENRRLLQSSYRCTGSVVYGLNFIPLNPIVKAIYSIQAPNTVISYTCDIRRTEAVSYVTLYNPPCATNPTFGDFGRHSALSFQTRPLSSFTVFLPFFSA